MSTPPTTPMPDQFGWPFLTWLRFATERAWRRVSASTLEEYQQRGVGGLDWRRGTRWTGGLSDDELREIEARYEVRFPADHRLFLQVLHATEPLMQGALFVDSGGLAPVERPGFYHWQRDEAAIRARFARVIDGLVFDVEHNALWRPSWGARPGDAEGRRARVAELVAAAPRLLPLFGHRYVLAEGPTVVLSVHQSDIIVYGADLREYLVNELHDLLEIEHEWPVTHVETAGIPFWGELIG